MRGVGEARTVRYLGGMAGNGAPPAVAFGRLHTHLDATNAVKHHGAEATVDIVEGRLEQRDASAEADGGLCQVVERVCSHDLRHGWEGQAQADGSQDARLKTRGQRGIIDSIAAVTGVAIVLCSQAGAQCCASLRAEPQRCPAAVRGSSERRRDVHVLESSMKKAVSWGWPSSPDAMNKPGED